MHVSILIGVKMEKIAVLMLMICVVVGCQKDKMPGEANKISLRLMADSEYVEVSILNDTGEQVVINRLFRLSGIRHELLLKIDGILSPPDPSHRGGFPDIVDPSTIPVIVESGAFYGIRYPLADVAELFALHAGKCYEISVLYQNKTSVPVADMFDRPILSNSVRLCPQ